MIRLSPDRDGAWIGTAAALALLATLAVGIGAMLRAESTGIAAQARVVTVAIAATDGVQQSGRAQALLAMLQRRGDLVDVHAVDPAIVRADAGVAADAPLPALIDGTLKQGHVLDDVKRAVAGLPGVAVTDDGGGFDALSHTVAALACTAHGIAIVALGFGLLIGVARGRQEHALVETLARLGADGRQVALAVGLLCGRATLIGGSGGLVCGVVALPFIAAQAAGISRSGMTAIGFGGASAMAAIPLLLAIVAAASAGAVAALRLRRMR